MSEQNEMLKKSTKRNFCISILALLFAGVTALANIYTISQIPANNQSQNKIVQIEKKQMTEIISAIQSSINTPELNQDENDEPNTKGPKTK